MSSFKSINGRSMSGQDFIDDYLSCSSRMESQMSMMSDDFRSYLMSRCSSVETLVASDAHSYEGFSESSFESQEAAIVQKKFEEVDRELYGEMLSSTNSSESLRNECQEWANTFPHFRILGIKLLPNISLTSQRSKQNFMDNKYYKKEIESSSSNPVEYENLQEEIFAFDDSEENNTSNLISGTNEKSLKCLLLNIVTFHAFDQICSTLVTSLTQLNSQTKKNATDVKGRQKFFRSISEVNEHANNIVFSSDDDTDVENDKKVNNQYEFSKESPLSSLFSLHINNKEEQVTYRHPFMIKSDNKSNNATQEVSSMQNNKKTEETIESTNENDPHLPLNQPISILTNRSVNGNITNRNNASIVGTVFNFNATLLPKHSPNVVFLDEGNKGLNTFNELDNRSIAGKKNLFENKLLVSRDRSFVRESHLFEHTRSKSSLSFISIQSQTPSMTGEPAANNAKQSARPSINNMDRINLDLPVNIKNPQSHNNSNNFFHKSAASSKKYIPVRTNKTANSRLNSNRIASAMNEQNHYQNHLRHIRPTTTSYTPIHRTDSNFHIISKNTTNNFSQRKNGITILPSLRKPDLTLTGNRLKMDEHHVSVRTLSQLHV